MAVTFSFTSHKCDRLKQNNPSSNENGLFLKGTNGCTLLLIHGLTGTPNEMKFLANYFNKKGYSVICPRLANHGEPIGILKNTRWQECYQSVREAFLKYDSPSNQGQFFAAGLSMGALLALLLAEEFPERISGVSCLSPTLFYDGWNTPWYRCFLPLAYFTPLKHFAYFKEEPPYGIKNEALQQRVHRYYSKASLRTTEGLMQYGYPYFPVSLLHQLNLLVRFLRKKLPSIHVPVQLIQANDDDMTSIKNSQFIYDRVNSKIKEIVLLYNSYHVITADQERETVAQKMDVFFERIKKSARNTEIIFEKA
jgi:carboxylesterase